MKLHLVGISNRPLNHSISGAALERVLAKAAELGATIDAVDLTTTPLPIFDPDRKLSPPEVDAVLERIQKGDAYILATPDYHGTMAGSMKNCLDYFWREFSGKLFGSVVTSFEKGLTVHDQIRTVVRQCYGWSLPYGVSLGEDDFDKGVLKNPKAQERLDLMAYDMVTYGQILRQRFAEDRGHRGFAKRY